MPQRFAQLSDPHLTSLAGIPRGELRGKQRLGYLSWWRRRQHEHRMEVLDALTADIAAQPPAPVLVTGDLTHVGHPSEFRAAQGWLQVLGDPATVALVPGNHDACIDAPWESTFALWRDYLAGDDGLALAGKEPPATHAADLRFPSLRVRGDIAFIGLSSAVPKPPLLATGTLGDRQLAALGPLLRDTAARGLFRVVYLHHCPLAGREKWRKRLTDAAELQAVLELEGAELVVHGHGHRKHYSQLSTRHGALPIVAVPSASALGLHGADCAEYNWYSVQSVPGGWQLDIDARGYDRNTGRFVPGDSATVQLNRRHAA